MGRFADDDIKITARDLPSFLYENGTVYNENNEAAGLFRGYLLVRVRLFFFKRTCDKQLTFRYIAIFLLVRHRLWTRQKSETRTRPSFSS